MAAFGHVTEGMEVVDKIANNKYNYSDEDNGLVEFVEQPVITSIKVID